MENERNSPLAPVWFLAALVPMVASQILRLRQHDPGAWIFWDYAGRLGGLAVLAAAWPATFRRARLRMRWRALPIWIAGIVLADQTVGGWLRRTGADLFPATALGAYPEPGGWLFWVDTLFGLALVAFSEEVVFRRAARAAFAPRLGEGWRLVLATSLVFGAYHWWTGVGNVAEAAFMGALFMMFLERSGALWPVVLSHYLTDVVAFW